MPAPLTGFLRLIPKLELHCHLFGTIRHQTMLALCERNRAGISRDEIDGYSVFGEVTIGLGERFDLTLGYRYHDQEADQYTFDLNAGVLAGITAPKPPGPNIEFTSGNIYEGIRIPGGQHVAFDELHQEEGRADDRVVVARGDRRRHLRLMEGPYYPELGPVMPEVIMRLSDEDEIRSCLSDFVDHLRKRDDFAVGKPETRSYPARTIEATVNTPVTVTWINNLKDAAGNFLPHLLPIDQTLHWANPPQTCRDETTGEAFTGTDCAGLSQAPYTGPVPIITHLHGAHVGPESDGFPTAWYLPAASDIPAGFATRGSHFGQIAGAPGLAGQAVFRYRNDQAATTLWYHDHTLGMTRLNVYAGEDAGYLITDPVEQSLFGPGGTYASLGEGIPLVIHDRTFVPGPEQLAWQDPTWDVARWGGMGNLWYHHVYMPAQNPGDPGGMSAFGRWMYSPWFWPPQDAKYDPIPNPYYDPACNLDDPATWQYQEDPFCEPELIPGTPNISVGMEQFNDTPIVNGVAYPTVTLEPKTYRFRMLNAANDRFFNLSLYQADASGTEVALNPAEVTAALTDPAGVFPTPVAGTEGPDWIQIGTEGGFLPAPVVIAPQVTTWVTDPTVFNAGNVDQHSLLIAPAERADVIVDFSQFAGRTLILYNDAPAAFPARDPRYDYYTGNADLRDTGGAAPGSRRAGRARDARARVLAVGGRAPARGVQCRRSGPYV